MLKTKVNVMKGLTNGYCFSFLQSLAFKFKIIITLLMTVICYRVPCGDNAGELKTLPQEKLLLRNIVGRHFPVVTTLIILNVQIKVAFFLDYQPVTKHGEY